MSCYFITNRLFNIKKKFMNLLSETIDAIKDSGHTPEDIYFIRSRESGHSCTWEEYKKLADIEYDNGYGSQKVASDLIIVFSDGNYMWRVEDCGREGWDFTTPFLPEDQQKPISRLVVSKEEDGYKTLEKIN